MTWLLRICSSLIAAGVLHAGAVSGKVSLEASKERRVNSKREFSGVVVWLQPAAERALRIQPARATILQKGKTFAPHIIAVPVGSSVDFPNFDPIFHNAFSNFSGQIFDVGLYPPGTTRTVTFKRDGIVRIFCNIHPTMSAVIAVLNTRWFAVSDRTGSFRIPDVPPGEYTLRVFHERATAATLAALNRKLTVGDEVLLPTMAISEAGFIPLPHKNKYGKHYPAVINDTMPAAGAYK